MAYPPQANQYPSQFTANYPPTPPPGVVGYPPPPPGSQPPPANYGAPQYGGGGYPPPPQSGYGYPPPHSAGGIGYAPPSAPNYPPIANQPVGQGAPPGTYQLMALTNNVRCCCPVVTEDYTEMDINLKRVKKVIRRVLKNTFKLKRSNKTRGFQRFFTEEEQRWCTSGWMHMPQGAAANCPPGLEYLAMIDQLLVHQKVELLEALSGFETNNKFTIKNSLGQKVYYAVETNDCLTRQCCGPLRPFDLLIMDNYRNQVMHMHRPLACDTCCFPCCLQSMEISSPPGTVLGTVEQEWSLFCPTFAIKNASGDTVLRIEGPLCTMSICGDVEFKILSCDGQTQVGKISKQWSGAVREMFTDSDFFGINFPMDLDVRMKAVMLGACFLIDAMFFEKSQR